MKFFSEETRRRMSESAKRRSQRPEFLAQVHGYWKPFCSEQELRTDYEANGMSQTEICEKHNVSLKRVQTSFRRYGITPRRQVKRNQRGEANASWKGSSAGYAAFHARLYATKGKPQRCEVCRTTDQNKVYDWANLTGRYEDVDDYKRMCRSCHHKYDGKVRNLGMYAVRKEVRHRDEGNQFV